MSVRKNAAKPVEYESNPANPLGLSCVLLKCRDLYTLSITSLSLFYEVFSNQENLIRLQSNSNFYKLAKRILDVPTCSWLFLMIYSAPHPLTLKVLEELVSVFSTARKLPKGLSLRGARGKAHLSPDDHSSIINACREAVRLTLILSSKIIKTPLESRNSLWLLCLKTISDEDLHQSILAMNSLMYELENNPKRLIFQNELQMIISSFHPKLKKFESSYKELLSLTQSVKDHLRAYQHSYRQFSEILFEITHIEKEYELDVPLEYYLKEHDDLRLANDTRVQARQALEKIIQTFQHSKGIFSISFAALRLLALLICRSLTLYTGIYLDTTSFISLDTWTTVPLTNSMSTDISPLVYGGYSTENNSANLTQKEALSLQLVQELPWKDLASLICLEREVSGTCSFRMLAVTLCKYSDQFQLKFVPWCRRAVEDLLHQPRWYPVRESIPIYDTPPSASIDPAVRERREMFRSLSVEEPPLPKAIYFNRIMSLDSRISCALIYWCVRGNTSILRESSRWIDVTSYEQDKEDLLLSSSTSSESTSKKKRKKDKLIKITNKYLVWIRLLELIEKKSEIIDDEAAYFELIDPSRKFREMELKTLATTEVEITEEMDDDDDESRSESEEEVDEDDEDNGSMSTDINQNSDLPTLSLIPKHGKLFKKLLKDRFALALLHYTASEYIDDSVIPNDFQLYEDSQQICQNLTICSKYIHDELYPHIEKLLQFAFEGPSDQEGHRYLHPCNILTSLLHHDNSIGFAEILCEEIIKSPDWINKIIKSALYLREGIVDNVLRSSVISFLSYLFGGMQQFYYHPSLAPVHQHSIEQTNSSRQRRKMAMKSKNQINFDAPFSLILFTKCKMEIEILVEALCDTVYKSRREDFLPCGDDGRCYLSRVARLLTVFADYDDLMIWTFLTAAMERRSCETEKIKFWPTNCPVVSPDHLWLAPFILLLQGGTSKLVSIYRRTPDWKVPKFDEENYGNSVYRCYYDVCQHFTALLAVLCTSNQSICLAIAENSTLIVPAMLLSLKAKDRKLNQHIYRIASAVISAATVIVDPNISSMRVVPFDAPATYFRMLLLQEGEGLDIACEMIRDIYCDLWGMNPKSLSSQLPDQMVPGQSCQTLPFINASHASPSQGTGPGKDLSRLKSLSRAGSDRRFPQLGIKSGSLRNLRQTTLQTERTACEDKEDDGLTKNESYLYHLMTDSFRDGEKCQNQINDMNDDEEDENVPDDNMQGQEQPPELNSDGEDSEVAESVESLATIAEWKERLRYERMRTARDFILYAFECIIELCENRMELQDRIADKCPYLFRSLYGVLTPLNQSVERVSATKNDDDSVSIGEYQTHLGVTGSCAQVLRTLVKRHTRIRSLIRETPCIEGLIDALDVSYVVDDKTLGLFIVVAIEQLMLRNLEAWNYIKRAGGVKGLLQLCHMGNTAVRILACNDLVEQIFPKNNSRALHITEEILRFNGLSTIIRMLHSQDASVQANALILLKSLSKNQLSCRRAILSPRFISELGSLLFSQDLPVVRVACEMMLVLGAEDQYSFKNLIEAMESSIQHVASIHGKKIYYRFGTHHTIDREEDKKGLSIKSRLIDIANGILSTSPVSESAFRLPANQEIGFLANELPETKHLLSFPGFDSPSQEKNTTYTSEYVSKEGQYYEEPRFVQEIVSLAHLAANVLAAVTDGEESNWPDGGAPLRETMKISGLLPTIHNSTGRRRSDNNILQYKS